MDKNKTQIKSEDGQWASVYPDYYAKGWRRERGVDWLAEDFVKKMIKASTGAAPGSELARCAELLAGLSFSKGPGLALPFNAEERRLYEEKLALLHKEIIANPRRLGIYETVPSSARYKEQVAAVVRRLREQETPVKPQRWARFPRNPEFTVDPGKARKFDGESAEEIIQTCKTLSAISQCLSAATAQAKALGASFVAGETPKKKFPEWAERLSRSETVAFNAAEVYAQRSCFAIYIERGENSGFVSERKEVKPDLGSARLFPDQALAEKWAQASFKGFAGAVVAVDIAPKSYQTLTSRKPSYEELDAVIAAKEAAEIDAVIKGARIQALEAELERRRTQMEPAPAPAASRPKSRL